MNETDLPSTLLQGLAWPILIKGEPFTQLPRDLYIPPDALEVILDEFAGPLDLLLYLIKQHNIDVLDIPIADVTRQYIQYIEVMQSLRLELAADYLVMAATLAEIKSRMLLPRPQTTSEIEQDPRAELVRRLQIYEQYKIAAEKIEALPRLGRDNFLTYIALPDLNKVKPQPDVNFVELLVVFKDLLQQATLIQSHEITKEILSIRQRMSEVLERLKQDQFISFTALCHAEEGRLGVVVTFIAMLELSKQRLIDIMQTEAYRPIYLKTKQITPEEEVLHDMAFEEKEELAYNG